MALRGVVQILKQKGTRKLFVGLPVAVQEDSKFPFKSAYDNKVRVCVQIVKEGLLIRELTEELALKIARDDYKWKLDSNFNPKQILQDTRRKQTNERLNADGTEIDDKKWRARTAVK